MTTKLNADTVVGGAVVTGDASGILELQASGNTALTINASRAIGVGASPSYGTSGQVLISGGSSAAPSWGSVSNTGDVVSTTNTTAYTAPNWLLCDSTRYTSATYSTLAAQLRPSDFTYDVPATLPGSVIHYVNGIYVLLGSGIWTSSDATTWTQRLVLETSPIAVAGNGSSTLVATVRGGVYTSTDNGVTWTYYITGAGDINYYFAAYGASTFVIAPNSGGGLYYSTNGTSWTAVTGGPSSGANFLKFVGSYFITGFNASPNSLWASTNGTSFTATGPASITFGDVAFGNSIYVAVGSGGAVYTATTPTSTWTSRSAGTTQFNAITYGTTSARFVAVGNSNGTKSVIYSSTDGITWALTASTLTTGNAYQVITDNTNYLVRTDGNFYYLSSNGTTWTNYNNRTLYMNLGGNYSTQVYANSQFVLSSGYGVIKSSDGITWSTAYNAPYVSQIYIQGAYSKVANIVSTGSISVIPAYGGVVTTTDNQTFTIRGFATVYNTVCYAASYNGSNKYVAIFDNTTTPTYNSSDGITWTVGSTSFPQPANTIANNGSTTWVVGLQTGTVVMSSTDGSTWTQRTLSGVTTCPYVVYTGGYFVALGNTCDFFSTDGATWTGNRIGMQVFASSPPYGVWVVNGRIFIYAFASGSPYFYTKQTATAGPKGCTFTGANFYTITDMAYGNNTYVAVGNPFYSTSTGSGGTGGIWFSTDGVNFFAAKIPQTGTGGANPYISAVTFSNSEFVAVSSDGFIYTSTNGKNWIATRYATTYLTTPAAITYFGSKFAMLGTGLCIPETTTTFRTPAVEGPVPAYIKT